MTPLSTPPPYEWLSNAGTSRSFKVMPIFPIWLRALCVLSLFLGAVCALLLSVDVLRRPQHMTVMNFVWPVCALFGTVVIVWLYFRYGRGSDPSDRRSHPRTPPYAVSVAVGTLHCGCGCTLGDILAEWIAFFVPWGRDPLRLALTL